MIQYIKRKDLNLKKYDLCIENSLQSNIFGFSWYLDIVADNWDVLVLNDYEAVMPIPWREKYFIKYVYQPLWTIQLGIFSQKNIDEDKFLLQLFESFKYVDLRMNSDNSFLIFENETTTKTLQVLSLLDDYDVIKKNYNRNRKRELKKASDNDLTESWNKNPIELIKNFKSNVGKRITNITDKDYQILERLMTRCLEKKVGELLCIVDKNNSLISSAFFLKHKNRVTELVCSSDFSNRNNGANTFMNDRAIYRYQPHFEIFDFGGSSMKNIRKYYLSFGANDEKYQQLKLNNLPWFLRFFKK